MNTPEMIFFDYGNTLVCEPDWSPERGNKALYDLLYDNKDISLDAILDYGSDVMMPAVKKMRSKNIEIRGAAYSRALFAHFGIDIPVSDSEIEETFWFNASQGREIDGACGLLDFLRVNNIKTGIISNMMWSGSALEKRLKRIFPYHHFDFVMTSADWTFRKPEPYMFDIALSRCGVEKEKIWFCGDNPEADIEAAANAGIFPVYFKNNLDSRGYGSSRFPQCVYKEITELSQLKELII